MNTTTNSNVSYPVVTSSSGNARFAAYQAGQENNDKLTKLTASGGGGNIPAPSVPISYKEEGTGSDVNRTINEIANIQLQSGGNLNKKSKRRRLTYKKRKGYFKRKTLRSTVFRRKRRNKTKK
jgi:hypothetical protein